MYRAGSDEPALLLCCGNLWNVFDGYALTGVGFNIVPVLRKFRQLDIPDEAVIHRYPLRSALAHAFCLEYIDVVDQLLQQRSCKHLHFKESADRRITAVGAESRSLINGFFK